MSEHTREFDRNLQLLTEGMREIWGNDFPSIGRRELIALLDAYKAFLESRWREEDQQSFLESNMTGVSEKLSVAIKDNEEPQV